MQEQQAEAERHGQHKADGDIAVGLFADQADAEAGGHGEDGEPEERREADQYRAGGAGKADMRQRVTGEGLAAQNKEIADAARDNRHDGRGGEGIAHELVVEDAHG